MIRLLSVPLVWSSLSDAASQLLLRVMLHRQQAADWYVATAQWPFGKISLDTKTLDDAHVRSTGDCLTLFDLWGR
jgi:hypothetical protein